MNRDNTHCTAVVLAAGSGKRMKSTTAKQFMMLEGKPIVWYSLNAVEQSQVIDDCILITGAEDIPYVQREVIEKYGFRKVKKVVAGGRERYESVYNGLLEIEKLRMEETSDENNGIHACERGTIEAEYVFIHDGARPFLTDKILRDTYAAVTEYDACVAGMPVKDTIKIANENGFAVQTPNRNLVWAVQTPQVFERKLITDAYTQLMEHLEELKAGGIAVTDDAFVAETFGTKPVKLVEASYENIKITTPEDMKTARGFLNE